jgi:dihydroneopterin aldolase
MREITLHGMRFHALVGIVAHERTTPQPIEIDLQVRLDDGDVPLDYRALYLIVADTLAAGHIDFLEQIGDRIARRVFAEHGRARSVRIAVRKPHVALPGPLDFAEVVTERSADA